MPVRRSRAARGVVSSVIGAPIASRLGSLRTPLRCIQPYIEDRLDADPGAARLKCNSDLGRTLGRVQTSAALDPMTLATTIGLSDSTREGSCGHLAEVEQGLPGTKVDHDDECLRAPGTGAPPSDQVKHLSLTAEAQCSLTSLGQQKRVTRAGLASGPSHGPCLRQSPMLCPSRMPAASENSHSGGRLPSTALGAMCCRRSPGRAMDLSMLARSFAVSTRLSFCSPKNSHPGRSYGSARRLRDRPIDASPTPPAQPA